MFELGIYSAIAPFVLLLLSSVWSYPAVLEEAVKWLLMRYTTIDDRRWWQQGLVVGLVFGLSEAVLFSNNAWNGGDWGSMGMRLILTVPMHALTAIIIAGAMKFNLGWLGLLIAMILHGSFNFLVH